MHVHVRVGALLLLLCECRDHAETQRSVDVSVVRTVDFIDGGLKLDLQRKVGRRRRIPAAVVNI